MRPSVSLLPFCALVALSASAFLLAASPAHAAAPKDAQAEKAITQALDTDFLETKFDDAEKRLRKALETCGADKCSPAVKARVHIALGVVLAGGKKQLEDAREAFVEALSLDKAAKPSDDMKSTEVSYAYDQARKQLKLDGGGPAQGPAAPSGQGMTHSPPSEQRIDAPVPLYVELVPELLEDAKKVTVTYLAPGASDWKTLVMKKVGEQGFGINIPCLDVKEEGELKYHLTITDGDGAIVTGMGSRTEPMKTTIKKRIDGNPPSWPGFAPPEVCVKVEQGPKQCLDDNQCNGGLSCVGGECVQKPDGDPGAKDTGPKRNLVSLSFGPDISGFSGTDICSVSVQESDKYVCVREDGSRYAGVPTPGVGNNVSGGLALSTLRVVLGYDRLLLDNFTVGAKVGFAFRTKSDDDAKFLPLHLEVRGAFYVGKKPFESLGARPFVFVGAGLAQVDTPVSVEVLEDATACGAANVDPSSPCTKPSNPSLDSRVEPRIQALQAYKQAGQGFIGLGGGLQWAPVKQVALNVGLRMSVTLPIVTFVLSPELGVTVGF